MENIKNLLIMPLVLNMFDGNTNVTADTGLTDEMKTYYSTYLIRLAEPLLVHDQFGQKHPIPKNGGKIIEFRKYDSLPKALTPLTEGVTPNGQKLAMSVINSTVQQYGGYIELSDILMMTAIDNNLMEATRVIADQASRTLDTITREIINGGTNVQFGEGSKLYRHLLTGGESSGNDYLTIDAVRKGVRFLKVMNARRINGDFVGIVHPDVAYDLMSDTKWVNVKTYSDPEGIYQGEIGKIEGCRFVETTESKVFHAEDLVPDDGVTDGMRTVTVASWTEASKKVVIDEALTAAQATALANRKCIINGQLCTISSATSGAAGAAYLTLSAAPTTAPADGNVVYPGESGAKGRDVYSTLLLGADAYGITEISDGGLTHIVKQLGSAGTSDPLNQRATCGWKATKTAERLVEQYMIRVETASTFASGTN
ncbi:MAG: N4-gp56 family major capsid protein [Clostridiaceae bacterium]|nr:N4-gp56 family major capsid protein [Clostridiaceae bacterium]